MTDALDPLKLASFLLQYPTTDRRDALAAVEARDLANLRRSRTSVDELLALYERASTGELERLYTETFDFSKQRSLHLTYHLHGDSRQRGIALLRLKQAYEAAGFDLSSSELPDYLPLILEFAVLAPEAGRELLAQHAISIELIRASLRRDGNVYAGALELVAEQLPGLGRRELAKLRRLAASGPPTEQVGLEPFAPPEVMGSDAESNMPMPAPPQPLVGGQP
ncbi:nitrate reductase molybdenum cofactor assembly chaperone [soil metagenome]